MDYLHTDRISSHMLAAGLLRALSYYLHGPGHVLPKSHCHSSKPETESKCQARHQCLGGGYHYEVTITQNHSGLESIV